MSPTLALFLFAFWLSLSGSFAAQAPTVLFTSNVTSLEAGQSAKLTCQVENFELGANASVRKYQKYFVYFWRDNDPFAAYTISAPDSSGERSTSFYSLTFERASTDISHIEPVSATFPLYELIVTPTFASTKEYSCKLRQSTPLLYVNSTQLSLTVTPPPSARLSSPAPSPLLAQPFPLTCTFDHFTTPPVNYSVQFSSSRDGQLAVFEVSNGTVLPPSIPPQPKVALTQGPESVFPTFNLAITEKVDNSTAYWCALREEGKATVQSNTWPLAENRTSLNFTSSKGAENEHVGTCAVGATDSELSSKAYSVQFLSDLGPKSVNLLGEYSFKPNRFEEFRSFPLPPWTSLGHGGSTSWPEFSFHANGTGSLNGKWWCVLAVGEHGTPEYREITSEKVNL